MQKKIYGRILWLCLFLIQCFPGKSALEENAALRLYTGRGLYYTGDLIHIYCLPETLDRKDYTYTWYINGKRQQEPGNRELIFRWTDEKVEKVIVRLVLDDNNGKKTDLALELDVRPQIIQELYAAAEKALYGLDRYFFTRSGLPPNATRRVYAGDKPATVLYHVYEDDPVQLHNGGAATSESQVLFFNYLTLSNLRGSNSGEGDAAWRYLRYFMMPHDGLATPQLPDKDLISLPETERLIHWLIQVAPESLSGQAVRGDRLFPQPHTTYKIYDPDFLFYNTPAIALDEQGYPDLDGTWPGGDTNTYKFAASLDADQWLMDGFLFGLFQGKDYGEDLRLAKKGLMDCLLKGGKYPFLMPFNRAWGNDLQNLAPWKFDEKFVYTGSLSPEIWYALNEELVAHKMVEFISAAQAAYRGNYHLSGPFMPVYSLALGNMTWLGPNLNTHLMLFQYRIFRNLCFYYWLSGDGDAKVLCEEFLKFVQSSSKGEPEDRILPFSLNSGINDYNGILHDEGPVGHIESLRFSTGNYGLYLQGLSLLYMADRDKRYRTELEEIARALMARQKEDGSFAEYGVRYGAEQAEAGMGLLLFLFSAGDELNLFPHFVQKDLRKMFSRVLDLPPSAELSVKADAQLSLLPLSGNRDLKLGRGQFYSYAGARVNVNETDNSLTLTWNGQGWQGANHFFSGSSWAGSPLDMSNWQGIFVSLRIINGSPLDIKLELNDLVVINFDRFKKGENIIPVSYLREQFPGKFASLHSINFVTRQGTSGSVNIKLTASVTSL